MTGRGERGAGTLLIAVAVMVMLLITAAGLVAGQYALALRQTANAADLAALSAGAAFQAGAPACSAATQIARRNGIAVTECTLVGDSLDYAVTVRAQRKLTLLFGIAVTIKAQAVAGRLSPVG